MTECSQEESLRKLEESKVKISLLNNRHIGLRLSYGYLEENFGAEVDQLHTVVDYIVRKTGAPLGSVLFSLKYIDRYLSSNRSSFRHGYTCDASDKGHSDQERSLTPLEITIAAFVLANKFLEDSYYSNKFWSETLKIPLPLINSIELEFLDAISFRLHVSDSEFMDWCDTFSEQIYNSQESFGGPLDSEKLYRVVTRPYWPACLMMKCRLDTCDAAPNGPLPRVTPNCAVCRGKSRLVYSSNRGSYAALPVSDNVKPANAQPQYIYPRTRALCSNLTNSEFCSTRSCDQRHPPVSFAPPGINSIVGKCANTLIEHQQCHHHPSANLNPHRILRSAPRAVASRPSFPPRLGSSFEARSRMEPLCVNPIS